MAIEKKILKNRPFQNAQGQYNFENDVNISIDQQGRVDVQNDLYTIRENNSENEKYINNPTAENINFYNGLGSIEIINSDSWIMKEQSDLDTDSLDFRVYWIDDALTSDIEDWVNYTGGNIDSWNYNGITRACGSQGDEHDGAGSAGGIFHEIEALVNLDEDDDGGDNNPDYRHPGMLIYWVPKVDCNYRGSAGHTYYIAGSTSGNCERQMSFSDENNMVIQNFPFSNLQTTGGGPAYTWYKPIEEEYNKDFIMDPWSFINHPDALTDFNPDGAFYILAVIDNMQEDTSYNAYRARPLWLFRLPKRDIYNAWISGVERTIVWGAHAGSTGYTLGDGDDGPDVYDYYGCGTWDDWDLANAFGKMKLSIKITPPDDYTTGFNSLYGDIYDSYHYTDNDIYLASPYDKKPVSATSHHVDGPFDFRPITEAKISTLDIQNYYSTKTERLFTSAPNVVNLNFSIAEDTSAFNVNYIEPANWGDIEFKAFVVNWDWKEGEPEVWDEIVSDFPKTEPELFLKRNQDNTYNYVDVLNGELINNYQEYGIKIIKAVVFSYYNDTGEDGYYIPLVWKLLTIKININADSVYEQDFGDIGGVDYTFIPWPQTNPIIGGISEESTYINTLQSVVKQNQFREDEQLDKILALESLQNDELGDYFGKSDVSQIRYFKDGSYDMNKLLMLYDDLLITDNGDDVVVRGEFHPYFDYNYWTGDTITTSYPQESCIGTLFINDNMNQDLRQKILIEMNMDEIDEKTIRDSSGNGFKGVLLADYAIRKDSKDIQTRKESEINLPETDTQGKAF